MELISRKRTGCQVELPFAFADQFCARPRIDGRNRFDFNFIHSYAASCGDVLGNAETLDPVPENLLGTVCRWVFRRIWI